MNGAVQKISAWSMKNERQDDDPNFQKTAREVHDCQSDQAGRAEKEKLDRGGVSGRDARRESLVYLGNFDCLLFGVFFPSIYYCLAVKRIYFNAVTDSV